MDEWGLRSDDASRLAEFNDNGWGFSRIADWIEANL